MILWNHSPLVNSSSKPSLVDTNWSYDQGIPFSDFSQFCEVVEVKLPLLLKILRNDLVIPEFSSFCNKVTELYNNQRNNFSGEVCLQSLNSILFILIPKADFFTF